MSESAVGAAGTVAPLRKVATHVRLVLPVLQGHLWLDLAADGSSVLRELYEALNHDLDGLDDGVEGLPVRHVHVWGRDKDISGTVTT